MKILIDSSCFDNIISQTGITSLSAYYSFLGGNEPCVTNINDPSCDFIRTNELSYTSNRVESRLTVDSGNFFIIALNHDGTNIKSGSIFQRTTSSAGQVLELGSGNVPLQFLTSNADMDDDGIPDIIEINGIRDINGNIITDMKSLGSDPCRKTIAVEIDYMVNSSAGGHSHRPLPEAINDAITMFNNAPGYPAVNPCPFPGFPNHDGGLNLRCRDR